MTKINNTTMGIETKLCDVSQEVDTIVYLTIAKGSAAL